MAKTRPPQRDEVTSGRASNLVPLLLLSSTNRVGALSTAHTSCLLESRLLPPFCGCLCRSWHAGRGQQSLPGGSRGGVKGLGCCWCWGCGCCRQLCQPVKSVAAAAAAAACAWAGGLEPGWSGDPAGLQVWLCCNGSGVSKVGSQNRQGNETKTRLGPCIPNQCTD